MSGPTTKLELSSLDETKQLIHSHPDVIQYVNTIKHVQGSTGITIDRMIMVLEQLCVKVYLEGVKQGLEEAKALVPTVFHPAPSTSAINVGPTNVIVASTNIKEKPNAS
jgi:hypothetical protein